MPDRSEGAARAREAARCLIDARAGQLLADLPSSCRPRDEADAYAVQEAVMAELGPVGGFKVGAAGPDAPPSCAPMLASGIIASPADLPASRFTYRYVESEIAFVLGQDLPPRAAPYTRAETAAAIATAHAGLEVLQSRFADPDRVDGLCRLADCIQHGAYVLGAARRDWQQIDFSRLSVTQHIGATQMQAQGNPAGDMLRLVQFLANGGAHRFGGLRAGQVITCGSWTGKTLAAPGQEVSCRFAGFDPPRLRFV